MTRPAGTWDTVFDGPPITTRGRTADAQPRRRRDRLETSPGRGAYRPDVQGLRAVAVIAVLLNHLGNWPRGGFVGVDIFFVISGYLITGLLLRDHDRTGRISFTGFYIRRIKRIIPAAVLVLLATDVASYELLPHTRFVDTVWDSIWSTLFVGNWRFVQKSTNYFAQGQLPSPLQHFWSLGVEEQFYMVWPWLMLALLAVTMRALRWSKASARLGLGAVIAALTVGSFMWAVHQTATNKNVAYFSTFSRAWELGVGALIAVAMPALGARFVVVRTGLAWIGLGGIIASLFITTSGRGFPAPSGALPVLSTAFVIMAGHGAHKHHIWPLTNPLSRYVGDISYSLYLWHFPVIVLLVAEMPSGTMKYYLTASALSVALSIATYHLVENPVRRSAWMTEQSKGTGTRIALLAALVCPVIVLGLVASYQPKIADAGQAIGSTQQSLAPLCRGAQTLVHTASCVVNPASDELYPSVDTMTTNGSTFICWMAKHQPLHSCSYGSTSSNAVRVAIVGDSHAVMLMPGLLAALPSTNWHLDTYLGESCPWRPAADEAGCDAMTQIQQRLLAGHYNLIITTADRQSYQYLTPGQAVAQMAAAWTPVIAGGAKVLAIEDTPMVAQSALECVQRVSFNQHTSNCGTSLHDASALPDPLITAARTIPGVTPVDLTRYFCNATSCPEVIGHVIVFRDTAGHITEAYSDTLGPYLLADLARAAHL